MGTFRSALVALVVTVAAAGCADDSNEAGAGVAVAEPISAEVLLDADETTILGQPLAYPEGTPQISSSLLTIAPGAETGWHHHDTPLYGHVLEGTLTVDYGDEGERVYEAGDTLMEAIGTSHNGRATGDEPVRILVVNIGADGAENTVLDEP